jgi:hypothetical protein
VNARLQSPLPDAFAAAVRAFLNTQSARHVRGLSTQVDIVGRGDAVLPVTVNASEPGNTWVCSPHTTYVRYAREELGRFGHPLLTRPLQALCAMLGGWFWRARIDHAVALNNWLLSTNVYPRLDCRALRGWRDEALERWPDRALWFRSLNQRHTSDWLAALRDLGFELIPSRQVYLFEGVQRHARRPRDLPRDFALLDARRGDVSPADEWTAADFDRAAQLYALLYLDKYSRLNPDYGADFLRAWHAARLLDLRGYRDAGGRLEAVVGTFALGDTVTAPIVGYDTTQPQERGLYRLLMAGVLDQVAASGARLNLSAGAAGFKRARGGRPALEYSAVYHAHLPPSRRRALRLLGALARGIGAPLMQRFEL